MSKMTLKEIKGMFQVGDIWEATSTYNPDSSGPRRILEVRGIDMISEQKRCRRSFMTWPKASHVIEARPGYLKFRLPDHERVFEGHTVELIKVDLPGDAYPDFASPIEPKVVKPNPLAPIRLGLKFRHIATGRVWAVIAYAFGKIDIFCKEKALFTYSTKNELRDQSKYLQVD